MTTNALLLCGLLVPFAYVALYVLGWIAYRLDANVNMLTLGINKRIDDHFALDFSVRHVVVNAVANDYDVTSMNAGLLARF